LCGFYYEKLSEGKGERKGKICTFFAYGCIKCDIIAKIMGQSIQAVWSS